MVSNMDLTTLKTVLRILETIGGGNPSEQLAEAHEQIMTLLENEIRAMDMYLDKLCEEHNIRD